MLRKGGVAKRATSGVVQKSPRESVTEYSSDISKQIDAVRALVEVLTVELLK